MGPTHAVESESWPLEEGRNSYYSTKRYTNPLSLFMSLFPSFVVVLFLLLSLSPSLTTSSPSLFSPSLSSSSSSSPSPSLSPSLSSPRHSSSLKVLVVFLELMSNTSLNVHRNLNLLRREMQYTKTHPSPFQFTCNLLLSSPPSRSDPIWVQYLERNTSFCPVTRFAHSSSQSWLLKSLTPTLLQSSGFSYIMVVSHFTHLGATSRDKNYIYSNFTFSGFLLQMKHVDLQISSPALIGGSFPSIQMPIPPEAYRVGYYVNMIQTPGVTAWTIAAWRCFWRLLDTSFSSPMGPAYVVSEMCPNVTQGVLDTFLATFSGFPLFDPKTLVASIQQHVTLLRNSAPKGTELPDLEFHRGDNIVSKFSVAPPFSPKICLLKDDNVDEIRSNQTLRHHHRLSLLHPHSSSPLPSRRSLPLSSELVVAWCTEDISWVPRASSFFSHTVVYSKCNQPLPFSSSEYPLISVISDVPNVGSCDHSYAYHIWSNYPNLANWTVFYKGLELITCPAEYFLSEPLPPAPSPTPTPMVPSPAYSIPPSPPPPPPTSSSPNLFRCCHGNFEVLTANQLVPTFKLPHYVQRNQRNVSALSILFDFQGRRVEREIEIDRLIDKLRDVSLSLER